MEVEDGDDAVRAVDRDQLGDEGLVLTSKVRVLGLRGVQSVKHAKCERMHDVHTASPHLRHLFLFRLRALLGSGGGLYQRHIAGLLRGVGCHRGTATKAIDAGVACVWFVPQLTALSFDALVGMPSHEDACRVSMRTAHGTHTFQHIIWHGFRQNVGTWERRGTGWFTINHCCSPCARQHVRACEQRAGGYGMDALHYKSLNQ